MLKELYRFVDLDLRDDINIILEKLLDKSVFQFIKSSIALDDKTVVLDSESIFNIDVITDKVNSILNFQRVNNIRWVNKYFEAVNTKLNLGGIFFGCVETYVLRRKRILGKHSRIFSYPQYFLDFILRRVFPKMKFTRKIFYLLTRGENRAVSRVETYGRLYSCGFELVCEKEINNLQFFVFRKVSEPKYDSEPTYGSIIKLKRIGKGGKVINVRKFRTMYAYSEYLQNYVYEHNLLEMGGKFKNDYRVTPWGKFLRTFWIDEMPMLWNWIKRDLKLVGVRPLSKQYYEMYDEDLKQLRIKYKPGLIPPFYADMPNTFPEIMESERKYLESYKEKPWRTQWKYFWKAMYNILIKRVRSK